MKVSVNIWTMDSDRGYVPSSGYGDVYLLPAEIAAGADGGMALFDLAVEHERFPVVARKDVQDAEPYSYRSGVCNYEGVKGTYEVPDGFVAVQVEHENISTRDNPSYGARILNPDSLKSLYQERAERYAALASS